MSFVSTPRRLSCLSAGVIGLTLLLDQVLKWAVKTNLSLHESIDVTSWFQITFVENQGMAWGMTIASTWILTLFRLAAIGAFVWLLIKAIRRQKPAGLIACLSLIVAGAAGNIIDNCLYGLIFSQSYPAEWGLPPASLVSFGQGYGTFLSGKVVDMFYFPLFTFPESWPLLGGKVFFNAIFNLADAAISCGAVALLLFYSKHLSSRPESCE